MEHGKTSITPAEFETWLSPRAVLAALADHNPRHLSIALILKRILDDDILAAARKMIFRHEQQERTVHHAVIPKRLWATGAGADSTDAFWTIADLVFPVGGGVGSHVSCVEVRFDPEGVSRLLPQTTPSFARGALAAPRGAASPRRPRLPPKIDFAVLKAWYDQFSAGHTGLVYRVVQAAADTEFAGRRVPRALVRRVMGPGKRGNPSIRRR